MTFLHTIFFIVSAVSILNVHLEAMEERPAKMETIKDVAYHETIIQTLQKNWVCHLPLVIRSLESKVQWYLLIKDNNNVFNHEDELIKWLITKFGLEQEAECEKTTYGINLWVKEDTFGKFQKIFDLKVTYKMGHES